MKSTSLNLPYLALTGVLVVVIAVLFVVYRPLWQSVRGRQTQARETRATLAEKQALLQTIDRKQAQLATEQQHERQLAVVLPTDEATDDVARIIHRTAESAGMAVVRVTNASKGEQSVLKAEVARGKTTTLAAGVVPHAVTIEARGTYQQFRAWLEQLTNSVRLMDVVSLTVRRNEKQVDQIEAELYVRFYSYQSTKAP